jgi:hypothetical protein
MKISMDSEEQTSKVRDHLFEYTGNQSLKTFAITEIGEKPFSLRDIRSEYCSQKDNQEEF